MAKLLCIDSSSRSSTSVTRELTEAFVSQWKSANPKGSVKHHDLVGEHVPFLTDADITNLYTPEEQRTAEMKEQYNKAIRWADELIDADLIVIGAPMYNFTVPASLKAYIDLIVAPGKTFAYDGGAPVALLAGQNKRIIVFTASGGNYDEPPYKAADFFEPYLRTIFGFIGITDLTFVKVQGHAPELVREQADAALNRIKTLVAGPVTA